MIREHLGHLEKELGTLSSANATEQRKTMQAVVGFLEQHIKSHAEWEEKVLYPAVDRRACTGAQPLTASMRWEHRIVGRWTDELAALARNAAAFARRADNLLGLLQAHFEEEEEVLLPILDRAMTPAEFKKEIPLGEHH